MTNRFTQEFNEHIDFNYGATLKSKIFVKIKAFPRK
jgi:hypothetical protein